MMKNALELFETVLVPLVGHVRIPLLSSKERAEFVANLEVESARIKSGKYTLFERDAFLEHLRHGYAEHLQAK